MCAAFPFACPPEDPYTAPVLWPVARLRKIFAFVLYSLAIYMLWQAAR